MAPPEFTVAAFAVPPELTNCTPPLSITVRTPLPPAMMVCAPPVSRIPWVPEISVVPTAIPATVWPSPSMAVSPV